MAKANDTTRLEKGSDQKHQSFNKAPDRNRRFRRQRTAGNA